MTEILTPRLNEKKLLTVPEVMLYTGWGENYTRNVLNTPKNDIVYRIGNRIFANRSRLDAFIDKSSGC